MLISLLTLALTLPLEAGVTLGASEQTNAPALSRICERQTRRTLDPAQLPLAQSSHVQIDCQGYAFLGAPRLAEFVFADGSLTHVWILVEATELDTLEMQFAAAYGPADARAAEFSAWYEARTAVRKDVPEALYYSAHAAPLFEAWFSGQGG
ncbi:hypothetical protein [Oceanicaulis sp.]|uniref:hypothetical protein n=1 Tax=Oceanicaulis sp. TaxID=1924941 RepID=UPI003D266246